MKVKLDAFVRVKKAIDDMITQLAAEKQDEMKHKDWCVDEFDTNQVQSKRGALTPCEMSHRCPRCEMISSVALKAVIDGRFSVIFF